METARGFISDRLMDLSSMKNKKAICFGSYREQLKYDYENPKSGLT